MEDSGKASTEKSDNDFKFNFQTSIKGSSRTVPEDPMKDPGRAFTEESKIALELHEKPLHHF